MAYGDLQKLLAAPMLSMGTHGTPESLHSDMSICGVVPHSALRGLWPLIVSVSHMTVLGVEAVAGL